MTALICGWVLTYGRASRSHAALALVPASVHTELTNHHRLRVARERHKGVHLPAKTFEFLAGVDVGAQPVHLVVARVVVAAPPLPGSRSPVTCGHHTQPALVTPTSVKMPRMCFHAAT